MSSDPAHDLLLRDHIEVLLLVDADAARDLPDQILKETLGQAALNQVRETLEQDDDHTD